jgi:hypothetical protein
MFRRITAATRAGREIRTALIVWMVSPIFAVRERHVSRFLVKDRGTARLTSVDEYMPPIGRGACVTAEEKAEALKLYCDVCATCYGCGDSKPGEF